MAKFSVKKPFTILVMILVMIMLGAVSLTRMQFDLLPEISLPYIMVITTYPGASPESVESTISEPLESALGTLSGVENVYSYSYENYSLVELEFSDGTDLDAVLVKVYTSLDTVKADFPEMAGTPQVLEIGTDMLASEYLAVGYEGMSIEELSRFVQDTIAPSFERQEGVASVTTTGLIEQTVQVELDSDKVDALNEKLRKVAQDALDEAQDALNEAREGLEDGQRELDDSQSEIERSRWDLAQAERELKDGQAELDSQKEDALGNLAQASQALDQLSAYQTQLLAQQAQKQALETVIATIDEQMSALGLDEGLFSNDLAPEELLAALQAWFAPLGGADGAQQPDGAEQADGVQQSDEAERMDPAEQTDGGGAVEETAPAEGDVPAEGAEPAGDAVSAQDITPEQLEQLVSVLSMRRNASSELGALEIEIQVTQAIISEYERQLNELGVNYTDIERAKMETSIAFAEAQMQITAGESTIESARAQLDAARTQLESAQKQIDDGWESYYDGLEEFERQSAEALRSANADQLLSLQTLASIIYAQNFSMPAGYLDDENDNSWLLKVGANYESLEELEDLVLVHLGDVGDVRLGDVANLTIIDNSDTTFTRLNGEEAVILSIFKSSTAGTNEVSRICRAEIERLEKAYPGLSILVVTDQGDYIDLIVQNVVQNMIVGAGLAILILAIFLRDVLPTIVVAISIPLSVLTSLVAMYFSGISLNMMSLSGMALGIGMLVDNSVVVIENIYRLRGKSVEAPRAAVHGTNQVAGAVVASTLTTVCVFFPMVYTSGLVRELMMPMSLTIIFCLLSSLLIAMTVVPASASTLLRRTRPKEHRFFDKVQDGYGKILVFCLRRKIVPLAVAIGLLALSVWQVLRMGLVVIPDITSNQLQASLVFPDEMDRASCYEAADEAIYRIGNIDGVGSVAVMTGGAQSLVASAGSSNYHSYSFMMTTENENAGSEEIRLICDEIEAAVADLGGELSLSTGMSEMSQIFGSGLSVNIYGPDPDTLLAISEDIMGLVAQVEGYTEISNGQEDADPVLHLYLDKNKAMAEGFSVAQIYQELAGKLTTSADAVKVTLDGTEMTISVVNSGIEPLTYENLGDYTFAVSVRDEDGNTVTEERTLSEYGEVVVEDGFSAIQRENQSHYITVTAAAMEGYNTTLLSRQLEPVLESYEVPDGYTVRIGGETESVNQMIEQMALVMLLGLAFVYLVMVAQFQSLLSPFIVLFTIPLAFTGGLLALWFTGEPLSIISLMGFLVLLGTVVNNGIVFVDYTNQLRVGGLERHAALIATGKTRMRPILMTALTTILAEASLIVGDDMGSQLGKGMALVIAGGLAYATLMTLFIIPVMYDILFKKPPLNVDTGGESLDDVPDDAAEFLEMQRMERESGEDAPEREAGMEEEAGAGEEAGTEEKTGAKEEAGAEENERAKEGAE